jgi:fructose-specific phosphotransferase system IIA component
MEVKMLLQELIDEDLIICSLGSRDKRAVIEEMVDLFVKKGVIDDRADFLDAILKREEIESTAIGGGIAIPHGRSNSVKQLKVAFARSKDGVQFNALDKRPVYLIFMVAAPLEARKEYLQAVAKVARFLKSEVMKKGIIEAETEKKIMDIVRDFDGVVPEKIKVETKEGRVVYTN